MRSPSVSRARVTGCPRTVVPLREPKSCTTYCVSDSWTIRACRRLTPAWSMWISQSGERPTTLEAPKRWTEPASFPLTIVSVPRSQIGTSCAPGAVISAKSSPPSRPTMLARSVPRGRVARRLSSTVTEGTSFTKVRIFGPLLCGLPGCIDVGERPPRAPPQRFARHRMYGVSGQKLSRTSGARTHPLGPGDGIPEGSVGAALPFAQGIDRAVDLLPCDAQRGDCGARPSENRSEVLHEPFEVSTARAAAEKEPRVASRRG